LLLPSLLLLLLLLLHEQSARFYMYAQHEHAVCTTESSHLAV
jgi:hypothetical protein